MFKNKNKAIVISIALIIIFGLISLFFIYKTLNESLKKEIEIGLNNSKSSFSSVEIFYENYNVLNPIIKIHDFENKEMLLKVKEISILNAFNLTSTPSYGMPINKSHSNKETIFKLKTITYAEQTLYKLAAYKLLPLSTDPLLKDFILTLNNGSDLDISFKSEILLDKVKYELKTYLPLVESSFSINLEYFINLTKDDYKSFIYDYNDIFISNLSLDYINNKKDFFKDRFDTDSSTSNFLNKDFYDKFKKMTDGETSSISMFVKNKNNLSLSTFNLEVSKLISTRGLDSGEFDSFIKNNIDLQIK